MQKKNKGITLVALVITIIILLILAGITISLTIGHRGILTRAQEAGVKTNEAMAREKLELVLLDMQVDKTSGIYDEEEYIDTKIIQNGMTISGDIVLVDGWKFQIDRSIPKIVDDLGNGELGTVAITTSYIGTSSFTVAISSAYHEDEIEGYVYVIDGEEIASTQKEYTTQGALEPESTHTVQVIASYKDGTTIKSNKLTVKTEPRTYLIKDGNLQIEEGIIKNAILTPNLEGKYAKLEVTPTNLRGGYVIIYDMTQYKEVKIDVETIIADTQYGVAFEIMDKDEDTFTSKAEEIDICTLVQGGETSKARDIYTLNVKDIQGIYKIDILKSGEDKEGSATMYIYNLWLEK